MVEGEIAFPRTPLLSVCGPLVVVQLLETTFLNLVNFASLVTTNAARFRLAAGSHVDLLEFGMRRAQGPDGAVTASRCCYVGGFDGTSNVLAGKLYNIPVRGTHAHSFVCSFTAVEQLQVEGVQINGSFTQSQLLSCCDRYLPLVCRHMGNIDVKQCNRGELIAFTAYATSFPDQFLALIDTYDVLRSGLPNFLSVCAGLYEFGKRAVGVRLDSGDLAAQSIAVRGVCKTLGKEFNISWLADIKIVASNDINEDKILHFNKKGHSIDSFGIGTHLVTCQSQPSLGCVFKLVELDEDPRMKISEDAEKISFPATKQVYRLFGKDGLAILDLMTMRDEPPPLVNCPVLCLHPFDAIKRVSVRPTSVKRIFEDASTFDEHSDTTCSGVNSVEQARKQLKQSLDCLPEHHKQLVNAKKYKVSVSQLYFNFIRDMWSANSPIKEIS